MFLHREGSTNGCEKPVVPGIGELEPWVYEAPIKPDGELIGWKKELDTIGQRLIEESNEAGRWTFKRSALGESNIDWFGHVTDVRILHLLFQPSVNLWNTASS